MKGFSLFMIFGFILAGLTLRGENSPLISHRKSDGPVRSIANNDSGKCMRDLFNTEVLKKEIQELETAMDTNRIQGRWRHLNLAELPTPAADFLKRFGDKLGDRNGPLSMETCDDVPCLFNLIYGTPDGIAGLVHYLWFLRSGVYLAADNMVPEQTSSSAGQYNGKLHPLSSYLFEEDELYGFWRLSRMLKAPHTSLTRLNEIQRIPRGEIFEGGSAAACGLAHSDGWINLTDQCLHIYPRSDSGHFFASIIHELSHELDYEEGIRHNDEFFRSHWDDFITMSGFELREYRNSAGQQVRQWILKPDARIVTAYGRNSPQENFAELLAYYRIDGDSTKPKINKPSWDFAAGFYQGRSFEFQKLSESWVKEGTLRKTKDILKSVVSCGTKACVDQAMKLLAIDEMGRIRSDEPDGCKVLANPYIGQTLPGQMTTSFSEAAVNMSSAATPEVRQSILENFDAVMNPAAAYAGFFACQSSGRDCYEENVKEKKAPEFSGYGEIAGPLLQAFISIYPYEKVQEEVGAFYKSLLSSRERVMRLKSDELWESCKKIPHSDTARPTGSDYVVTEGYMISSFYNCLNRGFSSSLNASLDAIKLQEFSPRNPLERKFIQGLMKPKFTELLNDHLRSGRAKELKYRDAFTQQQGNWLWSAMRRNQWWKPRGRPTPEAIESACRDAAVNLIGGDHFFHLKKELYKDLLDKTCIGIN